MNNDNNYSYDEEGRLVKDNQEGIARIAWMVTGKIKDVYRTAQTENTKDNLQFAYDPMGNRIMKKVYTGTAWDKTYYYVHDATGNIMAIYTYDYNTCSSSNSFRVSERDIYGSKHIGVVNTVVELLSAPAVSTTNFIHMVGNKAYEVENHLGNVLATLSDKKIPIFTTGGSLVLDHYEAQELSVNDYYPFGAQIAERTILLQSTGVPISVIAAAMATYGTTNGVAPATVADLNTEMGSTPLNTSLTISQVNTACNISEDGSGNVTFLTCYNGSLTFNQNGMVEPANSSSYRYGFNGKEKDDELEGANNSEDYGMRIYSNRLGRFLTIDPITKKYPMLSPFQFASNSPISGIDIDGLEFYFAADGTFLGRGKDNKSTEVLVATDYKPIKSGFVINNSVDVHMDIKSFLDRVHMDYGEGGGNGVNKDGQDPSLYFAWAFQNAKNGGADGTGKHPLGEEQSREYIFGETKALHIRMELLRLKVGIKHPIIFLIMPGKELKMALTILHLTILIMQIAW